jgi:hypothetical protein
VWVLIYERHGGIHVFWTGKEWVQSFVLAARYETQEEALAATQRWTDPGVRVINYSSAYDAFKKGGLLNP